RPCSVKTYGLCRRLPRVFDLADCKIKDSASSQSSWNMKSLGNRVPIPSHGKVQVGSGHSDDFSRVTLSAFKRDPIGRAFAGSGAYWRFPRRVKAARLAL